MNRMEAEAAAGAPLPGLILSLEQATLMAKQLPTTTDPNQLLQIYSSLHQAHHNLSSFISNTQLPLFPPPPAAADQNGDEPMQVVDDDYEGGAEENSEATIERVEERMRECFIKNKRPKRPLSPSFAAEERRFGDDGYGGGMEGFDPHGTRLRALDLIYQFHG